MSRVTKLKRTRLGLAGCLCLVMAACGSAERQPKKLLVGWEPVISFQGHGDSQSEAFNIESTQWRIRWETKNEETPGAGRFKLTAHSSVSGRPIAQAVDFKGVGKNLSVISEDPRFYFLVIESSGVDWSISAEQRFEGERRD